MKLVTNNKLRIKAMPKQIGQEVQEKYIRDNKLIIDLDDKSISPLHKLLIQLYYYHYLKFIYEAGRGRVLFQQLSEYMEKYHNVKDRYTKDVVAEMEFYKLIEKSKKWGNNFIKMTYPAQKFFNDGKQLKRNEEIGSLKRNAFISEHYLRFKPNKRQEYIRMIVKLGVLTSEKIEELEKYNIFIENIVMSKTGDSYIVFGLLDVLDSLTIKDIKSKIELINENLHYKDKMFFRLNVCTNDYSRYEFLSSRWKKGTYVEANQFDKISFTNLNIQRYFTSSGEFRLKDYLVNNTLEELENLYVYKEKIDRDTRGNMLITFAVLNRNTDIMSLKNRIVFIDNCILNAKRKIEFKLNVYVDADKVEDLNKKWQLEKIEVKRFKGLEFLSSTKTDIEIKPKITVLE